MLWKNIVSKHFIIHNVMPPETWDITITCKVDSDHYVICSSFSHYTTVTWNPHFTTVHVRPERIFSLLNICNQAGSWEICVSLAGRGAKVGGWRCKAKVGQYVPFSCCSFPSSTSSSLMSPLGTLDLPPRGPFTWLTKVRKQTFFLSINNGPISPLRRYQALHWHSTLIQSACRNTKGTLDSPY